MTTFDKKWLDEINAIRDQLWINKIKLSISESRDGYGNINPIELEKYLEMAMEGKSNERS